MKLAFISTISHVSWGGSEALWSKTAKLALQEGHEVFTLTCFWEKTPEAITELSSLGAKTSFFKSKYNPAITVRLYRRLKRIIVKESLELKALEKFDPDLIVINQNGCYNILENHRLTEYILWATKPYFIICHSYVEDIVLPEHKRAVLSKLFNDARAVFMICQSQANIIMKQLVCQFSNIRFVNNPVNLKEIKLLKLPAFHKIQFASVASLDVDTKGQDIALEVLSSEKWKSRNWQFNIYGDGPHKQYLEQLVIYFRLEGRVVFKGHVKDINALWKENHLLLISSRRDTGPMVLTEAMLCGRPVVATRVGKVPEFIQDGYNGFIADAATVKLFDEALERAWQNKEEWATIGGRAHQSALLSADLNASKTFLDLLINTSQ